eukprot:CAMPEP_0197529630 /NCGR_PEP_ID=MMETSP1318-20131121/29022_1 /TAXON_ID=552666 /ORGANISM="Partenskyella glossopodia, Strain RCC365" /LENGTH=213 /DNA_ID=CAMNT_0043085161 /DNA_START=26 /DNA_END=664 /DNA_ORIENTATION=-
MHHRAGSTMDAKQFEAYSHSKKPNGNAFYRRRPKVQCAVAHALLVLVYALPIATLVIVYPLGIQSGRVWAGDFFISSALDKGVGFGIGAIGFGLSMEAFLICAIIRLFIVRAALREATAAVDHDRLTWGGDQWVARLETLNLVAMGLGVLSNVGLMGATAFNVGDPKQDNQNGYFNIHIPFALGGFFAISLYTILQSYIDQSIYTAMGTNGGW